MTVIDIAIATIPGMVLLLAVGIGGDALSALVRNIAMSRHDLKRLTAEAEAARQAYDVHARRLGEKNKDLLTAESHYTGVMRELQNARHAEAALQDPHNNILFEIGKPLAGDTGWYVRLLLHRKHELFNGLGTSPTGNEGYRTGRLVIWGVDKQTAEQLCQQRFSTESSVLSIQPFNGKLKREDV